MKYMYIKARAKINLTLNVLDKRPDNYHNLESIFQRINLYDELYIEKTATNRLEIITNLENVKTEDNIIYKAYVKLKEKSEDIKGIKVILNKKIPTEAGLAGGSADCASFILAVNKMYNLNLCESELIKIGKELGADVCPCFYNGALKVQGIGEIIKKIDAVYKFYVIIIKPEMSCNTKNMFKKIDEKKIVRHTEKTDLAEKALITNNMKLLCDNLYNDFEYVIEDKEFIDNLKSELSKKGALGVLMTGSGSCVYGIFQNKKEAKIAYDKLKTKYKAYICVPYNSRKEEKWM